VRWDIHRRPAARRLRGGGGPYPGSTPDLDDLKRCTRCGEEKPLAEFSRARSRKDGRKACVRRWQQENAEHLGDYHRRWQQSNRDKKRAQDRRYRERNRQDPDYLARRRANDRRYRARKRAAPRPRPAPVEPGFLLSSRVASSRSSSLNRPAIRGSGGFATMSSNEYWSRSASSSAFHPSDWPHLRRTPLMYGTSAGRRQPSSRPPFSPAACATTSSRRGLGRSCRRTPARSGGKPRRAGPCVRVSGPNFACAPRPPIG
jgi:hypothetical protein